MNHAFGLRKTWAKRRRFVRQLKVVRLFPLNVFRLFFILSFSIAVFLNVPMEKKPMSHRQKVLKDFFYVNSRTHTKRNETKLTTTNSSGRWPPVVICSLQFFPFDSFPSFHFILGKIIFRCFCWWKHLESNARVD